MIKSTTEQEKIINSKGNVIVAANPGTGKTTTLALKVMRLLEDGTDPEDILCITFTQKAKKEMYKTIHELAKGKKHAARTKNVHIHTFHSFAYNYLIDNELVPSVNIDDNLLRFTIYDSLIKSGATHYPKDYIISEIMPNTANAIRYVKNFGVLPKHIDRKAASQIIRQNYDKIKNNTKYTLDEIEKFLDYFIDAYYKYEEAGQRQKEGVKDYTDILLKFLEEFDGSKYEHVLVDEMQDMNKTQAEVARRVANNIFLVGDQKQAIFGFQGGSIKYVREFEEKCKEMLLSRNRRSTSQILHYAKQYYLNGIKPDGKTTKELEQFDAQGKSGDKPEVIITDDPLAAILKTVRENTEKNIGIITRTNGQVTEISEFLDKNDIRHTSTFANASAIMAKKEIMYFLKGLLYDDIEKKVRAAFTIFSPHTLRKAFEFSDALKRPESAKYKELESWGAEISIKDLDEMFNYTILPICASKGEGWFLAATTIRQNIDQYWELKNTPTRDELFDYLEVCEEPQIEPPAGKAGGNNREVTVSTIHKAKGQEFDIVIYRAKDTKRTSFIDLVKTSILQSQSIDVSGELEEEQMRLHFVALTRAKEKLVVIPDTKKPTDMHIDGLSESSQDVTYERSDAESARTGKTTDMELQEAYSLFVQGKDKESQNILKNRKGGGWLEKIIVNYFEEMDTISYSRIKTSPSEFLKNNIIGPKYGSANASMRFGTNVHKAMAHMLKDGNKDDVEDIVATLVADTTAQSHDYATNDGSSSDRKKLKRAIQNGKTAIDELKAEYPGLKTYAIEKRYEAPINYMIQEDVHDDENVKFIGYIDAVFKHDAGYLIVDFKTDKNTNYVSDHRKQLAAYKKMFSYAKDISEDLIDARVVYVSITGSINTDRIDHDICKNTPQAYRGFKGNLQKMMEWKNDSSKFIDELLQEENKSTDTLLDRTIKEKLVLARSS